MRWSYPPWGTKQEPRCEHCGRKERECGELTDCERHFHDVDVLDS